MMPDTVQNNPLNGVTEPVVASHVIPFSTRRTSSADASCMFTVTAFRLFKVGGCGLPGAEPTWPCNSRYPAAYTFANGEPAEARACGLATPRVARKMRKNWSLCRWIRPNKLNFCKIIPHEITEKNRSKPSTPRATHPVCSRILLRSAAKAAIKGKEMLAPQFEQNCWTLKT